MDSLILVGTGVYLIIGIFFAGCIFGVNEDYRGDLFWVVIFWALFAVILLMIGIGLLVFHAGKNLTSWIGSLFA